MKTQPVIAFILPTHDMVHTDFALSFANLCTYLAHSGIRFIIVNPRSSSIDKSRNSGVQEALTQTVVTHLCFIDSDQMFPHDAVERLLWHNKDIVGGASVTRQHPVHFTAKSFAGHNPDFRQMKKVGLFAVRSNGFPLMLIKREVFEKVKFPWFHSCYNAGNFVSEDEYFCGKARNNDYDILVDCDLSNEIKHVGTHRFGPEDIE